MTVLATLEGVEILHELAPEEKVSWLGKLAVDCDGSGSSHGDPCYQPETSLRLAGKPLNADTDCYIVVPPIIVHQTRGKVLGCRGTATNVLTGKKINVIVGDVGPRTKIGEGSCATAAALGLDPSPLHGGTSEHIIYVEIFPGRLLASAPKLA